MRLTEQRLKKLLRYDQEAGIFTWLVSRGGVRAGEIAQSVNVGGYINIRIFGVRYLVHRLAWFYMTGKWPKDQIDHINGNTRDNRWANLREVTHTTNQQNRRKAQKNNKTGFLGVAPKKKKFSAQIVVDKKVLYLGTYPTPELAHEAYLQAKRRLHNGCAI